MKALEKLDAFRLARVLAVDVYLLTRRHPLAGHPILANQIARAAVSIPANIAEGYALGTSRQLVRGVRIAYGSVVELDTHLWIAKHVQALPAGPEARKAIAGAMRVSNVLIGLLKHYGATVGSPR
jgi:four helix bundle protein